MIHTPERYLGFGIPHPGRAIFLSAVRSAGKVLNLFRDSRRVPTSPVNQCLVEEFIGYAREPEGSAQTDWRSRVVPPLELAQDCPYPAVQMGKWATVLPLDVLEFGPISSQRIAANRAASQWPWLLSALRVLRAKVALGDSNPLDPVLRGRVEFVGVGSAVPCDLLRVLMSRARIAVSGLFGDKPTKYGAELAQNARKGLSCFPAPSLRNPSGQHLLTTARLGPISGAVSRLRAGSYVF